MEYLRIGKIIKTIGLKGEVKIYPSTHFRDSRFKSGNHVFLVDEKSESRKDITVMSHHKNGNCDNVIFKEFSSIEEAQKIVGYYLEVEKKQDFLKDGYYFYSDLEQLEAFFDNGEKIGKVIKVEEMAGKVLLRIKSDEKTVLVPFIKQFIVSIDLEMKKVIIKYIEGLL